jgi:hypothetical protein
MAPEPNVCQSLQSVRFWFCNILQVETPHAVYTGKASIENGGSSTPFWKGAVPPFEG